MLAELQTSPAKARRARWAIAALVVLSIGALFSWTQHVVGLRTAGDIDIFQANRMLEAALFAWYAVFLALVILYGRLDARKRKVPETPRSLAIQIGKTVLALAAGLALSTAFGAALGETDTYSLLRPTLTFTAAGIFTVCYQVWKYGRRRR